MLYTNLTNW